VALNELELALLRKVVGAFIERRRPPPHIRPELDLAFRISGQSVVILEVRPVWQGRPGEKMEHGAAKATYVRATRHWKVFWLRRDLKWHAYPHAPCVATIEEFLKLVDEDTHSCFFG
jgi:hypothetical protein